MSCCLREEPDGIGDVASFISELVVSAESWRCCVKLHCLCLMVLGGPIEVVGDGFGESDVVAECGRGAITDVVGDNTVES